MTLKENWKLRDMKDQEKIIKKKRWNTCVGNKKFSTKGVTITGKKEFAVQYKDWEQNLEKMPLTMWKTEF